MGYEFEIWQGGIMVVQVESDTLEAARREIMHYAMMYGQDGECEIRGKSVHLLMPKGDFADDKMVKL